MPIFLEPDQSFEVVLDSDADKPVASRPVFVARSQSMRGQRKIMEAIDMLHADGVTVAQVFDAAVEQLKRVLTDWRNMGREYTADAIEDALSYNGGTVYILPKPHVQAVVDRPANEGIVDSAVC